MIAGGGDPQAEAARTLRSATVRLGRGGIGLIIGIDALLAYFFWARFYVL